MSQKRSPLVLDDLSDDPELAFVKFESKRRAIQYAKHKPGNWVAEREYVTGVVAFIHEMEIDIGFAADLCPSNTEFSAWYFAFRQKIDYSLTRIKIRRRKSLADQYTPILELTSDFRAEIHSRLDQIRKIVRAVDLDEDKRDAIFDKISALAKEVDKSKTRLGAYLWLYLEVTDAIGKGRKNLGPLLNKLDGLMKIFGQILAESDVKKLPPSGKTKKLPPPDTDDSDDKEGPDSDDN